MITKLKHIIKMGLDPIIQESNIDEVSLPPVIIERTKDERFGDFTTNIAMILASKLKKKPREIAASLINNCKGSSDAVRNIEVAGPGFINFFMSHKFWHDEFRQILLNKKKYGTLNIGKGKRVLVEFVSANPTGPLHVGHGRGAIVGDVLSNVLQAAGYCVEREYYINDRGLQMENLGRSTRVKYLQLFGKEAEFPENGYKGAYIDDIAKDIKNQEGDRFLEKEEKETLSFFTEYSQKTIAEWIKKDLADFGVSFDTWFSEKELFKEQKVDKAINHLREKDCIYEKDNALWFKTTDFGDDKDRVLTKENGEHTYFAPDIAYHKDKFDRGFDQLVDIWGADHDGYVPRMKAAISASGHNKESLKVILVQMVNLKKGDETIYMSTRAGKFVTLSDVIKDVGADVTRFFFLMRSSDSHLDFDMELAKKESKENPIYYIQYAHARIQSIFKMAKDSKIDISAIDKGNLDLLTLPEEIQLIKQATNYPEAIAQSATLFEPHRIAFYLQELAGCFHAYYNKCKVISDDPEVTNARLTLIRGIQTVIQNALGLLGITPVDAM